MENNFLEILNGMKLYMSNGDFDVEEVDIPIEYFVNHQIIDDAVRNLIIKYDKNRKLNFDDLDKLVGFKIKNNGNNRVYLEMEYAVENGNPIKVYVCDDYVEEHGFIVKVKSFLREIDELLNKIFAAESSRIAEQLAQGEISRDEWVENTIKLAASSPRTAEQYMYHQAESLKAYHQYITDFPEYQEILGEEKLVTSIAQETNIISDVRMPSGRYAKDRVSELIPFEKREEFLSRFTNRRRIAIKDQKNPEDIIYKGFVVEREEENGVIIVIEPVAATKTSFIVFESNEKLAKRREKIEEKKLGRSVYADLVDEVLAMTKTEKSKDPRIISKYHIEEDLYRRQVQYLITNEEELLKGESSFSKFKLKRMEMIKSMGERV